MMEVKQNTAVDLNELLVPPKAAEATDELDDAIMTDLSDEATSQDLNCDLIKANEKSNNVLVITNGDEALSSIMDIEASETTILEEDAPVSKEMEDDLLAEDDVLPTANVSKISNASSPSIPEDDILADKVETSNSTTSSTNGRDPGDDLDTLLSKINDIVDDCLENEVGTVVKMPEETEENDNVVEKEEKEIAIPTLDTCSENVDESVVFVEDPTDEENNIENDETQSEEIQEKETDDLPQPTENETTNVTEITHDKSEAEKQSSEQQNEISKKTIQEEESVVPEETLLKPSETLEEKPENQTEKEIENVTSEEKQSTDDVMNDIKIVEESKDISTDIEEAIEGTKSLIEKQEIIIDGDEELLENNLDETSLDNKLDEELLDPNEDDLLLDNEEPLKNDLLENSEESEKLEIPVEQTKPIEDTKEDAIDNKAEEKEMDDATLDQPQENEINDATLDQPQKKEIDDATLDQPQDIVDATKPTDTEKEVTTHKKVESINKELKKYDKEENEDSDDEIVFYVDEKPPEVTKPKDVEPEKPAASSEKTLKQTSEETTTTVEGDDDDIVILDDDDEGIEETDKKVEEPQKNRTIENKSQTETNEIDNKEKTTTTVTEESTKDTSAKNSTNLDVDNSDNARDDFVTDKVPAITTSSTTTTSTATTTSATESVKPQEIEETNSNCSSSSNLLLEAKANDNSIDERNQEDNDNDNEEEDDDGDVELIENESKEAEISSEKGEELAPPAKRQRLSEDSQVSSNVDETSNKCQKARDSVGEKSETQAETTLLSTSTSLKRTHDVIELEIDDKSNDSKVSTNTESLTKKARTEEKPKVEETPAETVACEEKTAKEEKEKVVEEKPEFKNMIPSYKPIPLYPPPKLETLKSEATFSLDFLKKFRKSFDKMTKQDLEEMVLQKVVEAIIHKSEFAEMRDLIEKQEKLISSHRTKITELSKQFRDLEMVHNRVVKDIEQRNSQFIMPVKITRAVGLQVYIPNKKTILDSSTTTSSTSTSIIPASSPQRSISAASSQSNLTSPQKPLPSAVSQTSDAQVRPGSSLSSAVNAAITNAVRRGCAQKITPTRPVPSSSSSISTPSSTSASASSTSVYRNTTNQTQTSAQPRILNKSATASTVGGGGTSSANAANMQRNRYIPSNLENMRLQQQQAAASRPAPNSQRVVVQSKPAAANTTVPRRSEPSASTNSSNNTSSLDSYMNTLSQLTGGNTAVSITPAKPKEKAVIDLTDEDEVAPAPAAPAANAPTSNTPSTTNGPAANPAQRRSLPSQTNNTNSSSQFARNAPPLARIPPTNQMSNSNKSRPTAVQGQKSTNSTFSSTISTPPGTSITRINVVANTQNPQRVKYSHPAPLPATPPQAFNPSWKLPPPRPTIRISNLDNGIVISWTMEESMDRHAECVSYQIYAYQETSGPPMADSWRHVGDVKAMLLPMAVTLTQFQEGQRYFFAVRAVDCHQRYGPFSLPKTWS